MLIGYTRYIPGVVGFLARLIMVALIVWTACPTSALTAEPQLLIPDTTKFTFSSESKGSNKFCDLIMSAVKVPGGITLNAVAARLGPGDQNMTFGYEVKAFESKILRPSFFTAGSRDKGREHHVGYFFTERVSGASPGCRGLVRK
jgi:hypothetical protein